MIEERTLTEPTLPGAGLTRGIVPGGTFLADFLYPAPAERRIGAIIGWWERRRLPYNLIIGGTGLVTGTVVSLMMALNGESEPLMWFRAGVFWLISANVCYTLGPVAEMSLQKLFGRRLLPAGPLLFRAGLTAAVGVTLAPIVFVTIAYIAMALGIGP
ncbi:hypothetical protein [Candidatus Palauibacter sp.]|uniref:hypothetical protein n=1 Tax=Candidatus Palauibacter sp. TaxID=3101350 RepID=UPI003B51BFA7